MAAERVAKLMAQRGLCSRREAERLIERGLVIVDGVVMREQGCKAEPDAEIRLAPGGTETLAAKLTVVVHKPIGIVSTLPEAGQTPAAELLTAARAFGPVDDAAMARIVADPSSLSVAGRLDRAIVVFTSDHGDLLGDHGHSQKWTMYEEVVRVPLVVWSPKRLRGRGEIDALVQLPDVAPALFALAGVDAPAWFEMPSLLPALVGEPFEGRDAVYCEQGRDVVFQFADFVTMLRTPRRKLVHFLNEPFGQLFDLDDDPHEERNRWGDPDYAAERDALVERLHAWRLESAYRARDWADAFR